MTVCKHPILCKAVASPWAVENCEKNRAVSSLQFCYARENTEKKATWRCVTELKGSETGPFERLFNSPASPSRGLIPFCGSYSP